jgi:hypothetical protein
MGDSKLILDYFLKKEECFHLFYWNVNPNVLYANNLHIMSAFSWHHSAEGFFFWKEKSLKWSNYLKSLKDMNVLIDEDNKRLSYKNNNKDRKVSFLDLNMIPIYIDKVLEGKYE